MEAKLPIAEDQVSLKKRLFPYRIENTLVCVKSVFSNCDKCRKTLFLSLKNELPKPFLL